eukprot:GILK01000308.1.p2 GENE.GILK01000308.1~~GILK01000308.1.p2  ORF type:complete len:155 (-),score=19.82 GILK01000308.1:395-859(-)
MVSAMNYTRSDTVSVLMDSAAMTARMFRVPKHAAATGCANEMELALAIRNGSALTAPCPVASTTVTDTECVTARASVIATLDMWGWIVNQTAPSTAQDRRTVCALTSTMESAAVCAALDTLATTARNTLRLSILALKNVTSSAVTNVYTSLLLK